MDIFPISIEAFEQLREEERVGIRRAIATRLRREAQHHQQITPEQLTARLRLHEEQVEELSRTMPWNIQHELQADLELALANIPAAIRQRQLILQLLVARLHNHAPLTELFELRDRPQMYAFGEIRRILIYWDLDYHAQQARRIKRFLPFVRPR